MRPLARNSSRQGISLGEIGLSKIGALADALRFAPAEKVSALELFELMTTPWNAFEAGESPPWPNDICDDGTPFELSVAFDGHRPHLRLLVESQEAPMGTTSTWHAGLELGKRLAATAGAELSLFERVRDLFTPPEGTPARFMIWHAAVLKEHGCRLFKVYVNPQILGLSAASKLIEQALTRLDMPHAWRFIAERIKGRTLACEPLYFSVDLERPETARVKVYLAQSKSLANVDRMVQGAAGVEPGDAIRWFESLTGSKEPGGPRPLLCCFAFRRGGGEPELALHVPVRRYVDHDAEAMDRITGILAKDDAASLRRAVASVSSRPLEAGRGLITYASVSPQKAGLRVNVYLAPQVYAIAAPRGASTLTSARPVRGARSYRRIKSRRSV